MAALSWRGVLKEWQDVAGIPRLRSISRRNDKKKKKELCPTGKRSRATSANLFRHTAGFYLVIGYAEASPPNNAAGFVRPLHSRKF